MRGWTYLNEDADSPSSQEGKIKRDVQEKLIQELVNRWNNLEKLSERRSYIFEDARADYEEDLREMRREAYAEAYDRAIENGSSEEEAKELGREASSEVVSPVDQADLKDQAEQDAIVSMLRGLGVRLMRPYEHWNEEEHYMEYMENRYNNYSDY